MDKALAPRPDPLVERTLENSVPEFIERFRAHAASGTLYPQLEGSVLLEFSSAGRVLYLFDRCGPYGPPPGPAQVIVHGMLDMKVTSVLPAPARETLTVQGISALEGVGPLIQSSRRTWVIQARLPLVLSSYEPLPEASVGAWIKFKTLPPLHGFTL